MRLIMAGFSVLLRRMAPLAVVLVASCGGGGDPRGPEVAQVQADAPLLEERSAWLGRVGEPVDETLNAVRASVEGGQLPPGVSLLGNRFVGMPTAPGRFSAELRLVDTQGRTRVLDIDWIVDEKPQVTGDGLAPSFGRQQRLDVTPESTPPDLGNLLGMLRGTPDGGWVRVNLNAYSDVWTPADLRTLYRTSNPTPEKILRAWSGMAWDSKRARFWLYGGGHANYSGNDTYYWDAGTQRWARSSLPSQMVVDERGRNKPIDGMDKAPPSAHTYDNNAYLPIADRYLVLGGAADPNGGHFLLALDAYTERKTGPYFFDPARADGNKVGGSTGSHVQRVAPYPDIVGGNMWSNRESWLYASASSAPPSESAVNGCVAVAESNGKDIVYLRTAYRLYRYTVHDVNNPAADTWTRAGRYYSGSGAQTSCSYDASRKVFIALGKTTNPFVYWDMTKEGSSNNEVPFTPVDPTGEFASLIAGAQIDPRYCGIKHDSRRGDHVLWCGDGRTWSLRAPSSLGATGWTINKNTATSAEVPSDPVGAGVLGKWKYVPALDAFIAVSNPVQGNVWLWKPHGWVDPAGGGNVPPQVQLTAPAVGSTITLGQSVQLAASASDPDGSVQRVEFYAGAGKIGEATAAPFTISWTPGSTGSFSLSALAVDDQGLTRSSGSIVLQVNPATPPPNAAPSVTLTSPSNGSRSQQGAAINLSAEAVDSDGSVAAVEFYDGVTLIARVEAAPFTWTWNGAAVGTHSLTARAYDDDGAGTTSAPVQHTVDPAGGGGTTTTLTLQRGTVNSVVTDTYLSSYYKNATAGGALTLLVAKPYTPLVRFLVFNSEGGPVPDGAFIETAQLFVYKSSAYDNTYALHPMLVDWSEAGATWNQRLPGAAWVVAGAGGSGSDYAAAPDAMSSIPYAAGWLQFDVTAAVAARSGNALGVRPFGWQLRTVSGSTAEKKFQSSEASIDAALRPKLVITYR
jgi:hypothetical protein